MAIRSLHHLQHEADIADCFTMVRLCLELEASLTAVCSSVEKARLYLAYGDEVRVKSYRRMLERGDTERAASVKGKLPHDHEDPKKYRRIHWYPHQGTSGLIRKYGQRGDEDLYVDYCHMAHGNVVGNQMIFRALQKGVEEAAREYDLDGLLWMCLARYIRATPKFAKIAFGKKGNSGCDADCAALNALLVKVTYFRDQTLGRG